MAYDDGAPTPPEGFEELLQEFGSTLSKSFTRARQGTIAKRLPIRPEWRALYDQSKAARQEADAAQRKAKAMHRQLWAKVEADTGCYDDMCWNEDEQLIEVRKHD